MELLHAIELKWKHSMVAQFVPIYTIKSILLLLEMEFTDDFQSEFNIISPKQSRRFLKATTCIAFRAGRERSDEWHILCFNDEKKKNAERWHPKWVTAYTHLAWRSQEKSNGHLSGISQPITTLMNAKKRIAAIFTFAPVQDLHHLMLECSITCNWDMLFYCIFFIIRQLCLPHYM